jgi:hypothetical protein
MDGLGRESSVSKDKLMRLTDYSTTTPSLCTPSTITRSVFSPFQDPSFQLTESAKSFPVGETATYTQISEKVGLDELNLRRLLRHAMTNRIFKEVSPGVVAHTAASKLLAENQAMDDWVGFCTEDLWPVSIFSSFLIYGKGRCYEQIATPRLARP